MSGRGGELGRAAGRARSACTVRLHVGPRRLAGRARRPAPTRKRPAAFSATCLPGPSVAPTLLSLLFLPPPREREGGWGTALRRVSSPPAPPRIWGARRPRCTLARTFPRRAGHKDFGARCPPSTIPDPHGLGGRRWKATPALGIARPGHSPGRVAALSGKAQVVRLGAAEGAKHALADPHAPNSDPRETQENSGRRLGAHRLSTRFPGCRFQVDKHETDPSHVPNFGMEVWGGEKEAQVNI